MNVCKNNPQKNRARVFHVVSVSFGYNVTGEQNRSCPRPFYQGSIHLSGSPTLNHTGFNLFSIPWTHKRIELKAVEDNGVCHKCLLRWLNAIFSIQFLINNEPVLLIFTISLFNTCIYTRPILCSILVLHLYSAHIQINHNAPNSSMA